MYIRSKNQVLRNDRDWLRTVLKELEIISKHSHIPDTKLMILSSKYDLMYQSYANTDAYEIFGETVNRYRNRIQGLRDQSNTEIDGNILMDFEMHCKAFQGIDRWMIYASLPETNLDHLWRAFDYMGDVIVYVKDKLHTEQLCFQMAICQATLKLLALHWIYVNQPDLITDQEDFDCIFFPKWKSSFLKPRNIPLSPAARSILRTSVGLQSSKNFLIQNPWSLAVFMKLSFWHVADGQLTDILRHIFPRLSEKPPRNYRKKDGNITILDVEVFLLCIYLEQQICCKLEEGCETICDYLKCIGQHWRPSSNQEEFWWAINWKYGNTNNASDYYSHVGKSVDLALSITELRESSRKNKFLGYFYGQLSLYQYADRTREAISLLEIEEAVPVNTGRLFVKLNGYLQKISY